MTRRWRADTLGLRLFVLMWVALVVSHLVAFAVVSTSMLRGAGPLPGWPTFPSLPPTPGLPDAAGGPPAGTPPQPLQPPEGRRPKPPPPERPARQPAPWPAPQIQLPQPQAQLPGPPPAAGGLPLRWLLLDYAVRLAIIAAAAAWGARWLAGPMRRLVGAARELGPALTQGRPVPRLEEAGGTVEVREGARVFNAMAAQLDEQLRARELLAAALSHDLRTPLTRMRLRLETLEGEPTAQRCIDDVREMNELIDSSLALFRGAGEPLHPQPVDLDALLQSLVDDLVEQGAKAHYVNGPGAQAQDVNGPGAQAQGVGDRVTPPRDASGSHRAASSVAQADPAALRRVLANLLGNALRYGHRAEVSLQPRGGRLLVCIDDDGPGVPPAELEAVFQPFYRVEGSRSRDTGGAGLGLYIARDLVRRQGGDLVLRNRVEGGRVRGLRAELSLPAATSGSR